MSLKTILNKQTDFTGEFPIEYAKGGLWRFNEDAPDTDDCLMDSSENDRKAYINKRSGTSASLVGGIFGSHFRMNINNPSSVQTYLKVTNDGTIFSDIGDRIIVGGWMRPTTYSVGNTYCPYLYYELHGETVCNGYSAPGGIGRYGMGRTSLRDQVDARWLM